MPFLVLATETESKIGVTQDSQAQHWCSGWPDASPDIMGSRKSGKQII